MITHAQPYRSEVVDVSSADHDFSIAVDAIYCGAAGTVVAKLRGDSAAREWTVAAYQYLLGDWETVEKVGTTLTGAGEMIGVATYRE